MLKQAFRPASLASGSLRQQWRTPLLRGTLVHLRVPHIQRPLARPAVARLAFSTTTPRPVRAPRYVRFSPDPQDPFNYRKWDTGSRVFAGIVVLSLGYYVLHLEQVPETGRWRFMDVSPKYEAALAEETRKDIISQYGRSILPEHHYLTVHVKKVVARILEASDLGTIKGASQPQHQQPSSSAFGSGGDLWDPDSRFGTGPVDPGETPGGAPPGSPREWTVLVVNDKLVNAMAGPGTIVVFTGLLPICKDEAGLAAVLSHEIGHVVARHIPESYSSVKVIMALGLLLDGALGTGGFSNAILTYLLQLPNSRTHEKEADYIGLRMMSKACYDPRAAPDMFRRLGEFEKKQGGLYVEFLNTHPSSENRVKYLEEHLPEAYSIQAASPNCANVLGEQMSQFRGSVMSGVAKKPELMQQWE